MELEDGVGDAVCKVCFDDQPTKAVKNCEFMLFVVVIIIIIYFFMFWLTDFFYSIFKPLLVKLVAQELNHSFFNAVSARNHITDCVVTQSWMPVDPVP